MPTRIFDPEIDVSAEASASQGEVKFRGLFESAPDARVMANRDGLIVLVNARAEKMFGYDRRDILGNPVELLISEYHHSSAHTEFFWADLHDKAIQAESRFSGRRKDGAVFPVEINRSPLRTADATFVVTTIRDLSARSEADNSLRESEDRFRRVFQLTNTPMAMTDLNDRVVRANVAVTRMFGYSEFELSNKSIDEITHLDHRDESRARRKALLTGASDSFEMDMSFLHATGRILWGSTSVILLRDRCGQPLFFVHQIQQTTERKRLEALFRRSEQRLKHVVASSPAVLFTMPPSSDSRSPSWVSDNVTETLGYSVDEALQPNWWEVHVHPDDLDGALAQASELFARDQVASEYRFQHRDCKYRWVRSEMRLLRDARGVPTEIVGSWLDLTERKHLEDQFRQSQKMEAVGRLAGGVAHDFNNLLTVISGYSEVVLDNLRPGDPLYGFVEQIQKAGERAASLTRQLLAFSRKQMLIPVVLDINELITDIDKMLSRLIGEDIELHLLVRPHVWKVKVDPNQMEQVLLNLVVNARDAMPQGGKLTIETSNVVLDGTHSVNHPDARSGSFVLLAVSDTGCGMDDAIKSRIFEPFFTTKEPDKGTGLGLATVYGIVKQSGGHIDCYSEKDIGTTFKIYIPRADRELTAAKPHVSQPTLPRGSETVLLVEDDESVRTLARLVLDKNGYKVLEARNGGEALLLFQQHQADIAIMVTDVVMPNMSGHQLAQHLLPLRPSMKVVYLSGYTDEAVLQHGMIDAYTPFLQKPFTSDALIRKVREVLDAKGAEVDSSKLQLLA